MLEFMHFRELGQDEIPNIPSDALGGFQLQGRKVRVAAAGEEGGQVRAIWCVGYVLHAEPLWVAPDCRKSPLLLCRLWDVVKGIVRSEGLSAVVSVIPEDHKGVQKIAEWVGTEPFKGHLVLAKVEED